MSNMVEIEAYVDCIVGDVITWTLADGSHIKTTADQRHINYAYTTLRRFVRFLAVHKNGTHRLLRFVQDTPPTLEERDAYIFDRWGKTLERLAEGSRDMLHADVTNLLADLDAVYTKHFGSDTPLDISVGCTWSPNTQYDRPRLQVCMCLITRDDDEQILVTHRMDEHPC